MLLRVKDTPLLWDMDENEMKTKIKRELCGRLGDVECEVECEVGVIDIMTRNEIILIENDWVRGVGRLLLNGLEYPHHKRTIYLYDQVPDILISKKCESYFIDVYFW